MQGRKPREVLVNTQDRYLLEQIARSRSLPWFQVQHARTILAVADGEPVKIVAHEMQCAPSTVWRVCRRYENEGLEGVFSELPRCGHPADFSPCCARTDRAIGLSGTYRQRIAHYPLD